MHVAAEEVDAPAFLKEMINGVGEQEIQGDLWEDINDATEIVVGNVIVKTSDIPAAGVSDDAVAEPQTGKRRFVSGREIKIFMEWGCSMTCSMELS